MKQRIRVVALCEIDDKVLVLRRRVGRAEISPKYELPTGKIILGEQPDEAVARVVYDALALQIEELNLIDAITFVGLEDASRLANLFIIFKLKLAAGKLNVCGDRYDKALWADKAQLSAINLEEATAMTLEALELRNNKLITKPKNLTGGDFVSIYTDGGSRGNPGPSGAGYCIVGADGRLIEAGNVFLGFTNSRQAEYYALKIAMQKAVEKGLKRVHFYGDSLMMINQMNGIYGVKNQDLMLIYEDILKLLEQFEEYSFTHISREQNRPADHQANLAIEEYLRNNKGQVRL